jgi:ribosomal protein L32
VSSEENLEMLPFVFHAERDRRRRRRAAAAAAAAAAAGGSSDTKYKIRNHTDPTFNISVSLAPTALLRDAGK